MKTETDFVAKLEQRLRFIYKEKYNSGIVEALQKTISKYKKQESKKAKWDEKDIILITYGDSVKEENKIPLQTLKSFLKKNLKEQISIVHILPFFPYSSDDGFSVIDFRKVNPNLGNWEDIAALNKSFDLMADLVINHASSQGEWMTLFRM